MWQLDSHCSGGTCIRDSEWRTRPQNRFLGILQPISPLPTLQLFHPSSHCTPAHLYCFMVSCSRPLEIYPPIISRHSPAQLAHSPQATPHSHSSGAPSPATPETAPAAAHTSPLAVASVEVVACTPVQAAFSFQAVVELSAPGTQCSLGRTAYTACTPVLHIYRPDRSVATSVDASRSLRHPSPVPAAGSLRRGDRS